MNVAPLDCPEIECWQALFGDGMTEAERERYERHLESCPTCQERAHRAEQENELRRLGRAIGDPTIEPTDPTLVGILARLHGSKPPDERAAQEPVDLYFLRPSDRPDLLGTLGTYEVQEVIGQGGMGVVLKAFDPALHRLVAIKVMAAAVAGSATARMRFEREAMAAAAVSHDHIVTVHGVHEADGLPYLVMQFIAGESLQERIDRDGPLELVEIVRIGLQTASALAAAHAQGLIHRDIKPANILLENGVARVKITDFGLARMVDFPALTQSGTLAGTPEYMSPEQARGEQVDHRADLFSLGSVMYAMCTGASPFRASTTVAVIRRVMDEAPAPIQEQNPYVPAWLEVFVERLLAKDAGDRFQSAAEAAELLETYLAHLRQPATVAAPELPATSPPSLGRRPASDGTIDIARRAPRWRKSSLLAVAALAFGAITGWFLLSFLQPDEPPPNPEQTIAALQKLGADIRRDGDDGAVVAIILTGKKVTDDDLKGISAFPRMQNLNLQATQVTDTGLKEVAALSQLQELWLGQTRISDAGVKHLAALKQLKKLGLETTSVTDACAKDLAGLKQLTYLNIGRTGFTDAGVRELTPLTRLEMLGLYSTAVTDDGARHLTGLTKLKTLFISDTAVSDAAIKRFAELKQLKNIELMRTSVTPAGQKALEEALPGVEIKWSQGGPGRPAGSRASLILVVLLVLAIAVAFGGMSLYMRRLQRARQRRTERPSAASPDADLLHKGEVDDGGAAKPVVLPPIGLQCPGCDQSLKACTELAGKHIVCPKCHQHVLVPAIKVAGT